MANDEIDETHKSLCIWRSKRYGLGYCTCGKNSPRDLKRKWKLIVEVLKGEIV